MTSSPQGRCAGSCSTAPERSGRWPGGSGGASAGTRGLSTGPRWAAPTRPRKIAAALQGLDEDHDDCLPAVAVPFLTHSSPAARRAAVQAIGHYAEADDVLNYLVPLLLDSSGKVAATVLRHVRSHPLPASVLARLDAAATARSRRIALSIRQHSGTWNRVHADLTAINGHDPALAEAARTDLLAWLQHGAATSYGNPSPAQAEEIAGLLATGKLSKQQRRDIAFIAGIRTPAAGP